MKKAIVKEYIRLVVLSVLASILFSVGLCFLLFFYSDDVDEGDPVSLVRSISNYMIVTDGNIAIDTEGKRILSDNDLWLQIIDRSGAVVMSYNTPEDIQLSYSNIELVDLSLHSSAVNGYTVFIAPLSQNSEYGAMIGARSDVVTKVTFDYSGSFSELVLKCFLVTMFVSSMVVFFASVHFSRRITIPMSKALNDINKIQKGERVDVSENKNNKIFSDVFVSISKLQEELQRNDKQRAEWIVNISHDIKTPLSTINGYAELMTSKDYEFDSNEVREYSARILESANNINELVDDLRISKSLDEGDIVLNKSEVELVDLIEEAVRDIEELHSKDNDPLITYSTRPIVNVDRKLMKRCIQNIIGNAYIHNGKDVKVEVNISVQNERVVISVKDNGKGMTEEEKKRIFDRYYRGTNSQNIKGTGLGLAIAREVVRCHGGDIKVESSLGEGTLFLFGISNDLTNEQNE